MASYRDIGAYQGTAGSDNDIGAYQAAEPAVGIGIMTTNTRYWGAISILLGLLLLVV